MPEGLRIAILTTEFATERNNGGAGTHLRKVGQALQRLGHHPEVFVSSPESPGLIDCDGLPVVRVPENLPRRRWLPAGMDMTSWLAWLGRPRPARALAAALAERQATQPFELVISCTAGVTGLFVPDLPGRRHLVRVSGSEELWMQCSGVRPGVLDRFVRRLERQLIRQADAAYTGSRVTADFLRRQHCLDVTTIPGPAVLECQAAAQLPAGVPARYLMHFGRIGLQKGAADLAAALNLAWQHEPELAMVWAGSEIEPGAVAAYQQSWGMQAHRVLWLRHLGRPELYALLQRALAAVLPSRVDSLPNTAIESLLFGIPLIGTIGASVDEVVEPGRNGLLVPIGDPAALAHALLRVWRNEVPWKASGWQPPAVLAEMAPDCVAKKLLELAGLDARSPVSELRA